MKPGSELGAYRVLSQIGQGGMGTVWLAEHAMLGRKAAIKVLHPMYSAQPEVVKRFFNEARAATAISDPGIVQIFDFGQHGNTAYIAMELLDGEPLNQRLKRLGKLPAVDALRILRQVASALAVAHAAGIVHRDLKPENVFLVRDQEVPGGERAKLLDFGIAKITDDNAQLTQTSAVIGTPSYMSPEQCRGAGHVDQRSDLYAIGCLLFALLSGRPPFVAAGSGEIIAMHLREAPPRLSSRVPGVTAELEALVARCLEKDPARRFASASELAGELGELIYSMSGAMSGVGATGPLPRAQTAMPVAARPVTPQPVAAGQAAGQATSFDDGTLAAPSSSTVWAETQWPSSLGGPSSAPAASSEPPVPPLGEMATTLSSSVHTAANPLAATLMARSSRRTVAISAGLVLAVGIGVIAGLSGGGGGGGAELVSAAKEAPGPEAPPAAPSEPGAAAASADRQVDVPADVPPATPAPDPMAALAEPMQRVLRSFVAWAQGHEGAPCPTMDALGSSETDPWGGKLVVTCTEQPGSQRIGVISMGPDGVLGSRDDVGSWQLAREVTDVVHGARWMPEAAPSAAPVKPTKPVRKRPPISSDIPSVR